MAFAFGISLFAVAVALGLAHIPMLLLMVVRLAAKSPDEVLLLGLLRRNAGLSLNRGRREQRLEQLKQAGLTDILKDQKRLLPLNDSSDPGYVFPMLRNTGTFKTPTLPQPVTLWDRISSVGWMLHTLMYQEFGLVRLENARESQAKYEEDLKGMEGSDSVSFFNKSGVRLFAFPGHEHFHSYNDDLFDREKTAYRQALKEHIQHALYPNAQEIIIADLEFRASDGNSIKNAKAPVKGAHRDHLSSYLFMPQDYYRRIAVDIDVFRRAHAEGTLLLLGAWKPVNMQKGVCRDSLALLDMSSVQVHNESGMESDIVPIRNNILRNNTLYQNDAGLLAFDRKRHRWMVYPDMRTDELLLFLHYEPGTERGVFHSSVDPQESKCKHNERRNSVEARIMIRM
eukprot:TRINITY_DN50509_c0_g1_i1.p1 TRINITY_DN50509_c0_g1~~TRINITY_DN50509_c0_g1_i1.p1  ORF type:complete len:416 (-),score=46.11 TRINITY_DN50509_c0_g1_i1:312-1505(-)